MEYHQKRTSQTHTHYLSSHFLNSRSLDLQGQSQYGQLKEKGLTLIPLKIYLKGGIIKLEIALGRGKKLYDKRNVKKKKSWEREQARILSKNK